jgi:hypothetical protein
MPFANSAMPCPGGTIENKDRGFRFTPVPKGRLNGSHGVSFSRPFGTNPLGICPPKVETLGYCHLSLRDRGVPEFPTGTNLSNG